MVLSPMQVEERLSTLFDWEINEEEAIEKTFHFNSYVKGLRFAGEVGHLAEQVNHHPDLIIAFKKVTVKMKTHDEAGLTERDFSLAHAIERLYSF